MTTELFHSIAQNNSLFAVQMAVEEAIPNETNPEILAALNEIMNTRCLDTAHMVAHRQLGNHEMVETLRQWIQGKKNKSIISGHH